MSDATEPRACFYESQGLRLHYADWGNADAPLLLLVHGGRDHCRSWDTIARALQPHFHVVAPDLRGHGDSEWAKGSSYSLADNVYDLTRLIGDSRAITLVGHSFGGMITLAYAGAFPGRVARLINLDGAFLQTTPPAPAPARIVDWIAQLDRLAASKPRRFADVAEAAARLSTHNKRLTAEQAMHLATHAVRPNDDGTLSWKYDPFGIARAPYRLWAEDYIALWSQVACPVLLVSGRDSFIPDVGRVGITQHFRNAEHVVMNDAGHWLHHDRPEETIALMHRFLGVDA